MKIKKIRLKNGFKRFFDLTIDLGEHPKRIIALVGPNGSGKSSIFDGMTFYNKRLGRIGSSAPKDNSYFSMSGAALDHYQDVVVSFDNEDEISAQKNTLFSIRSPYRYNSHLMIAQTTSVGGIDLNHYGSTSFSDLDDKMEVNYRLLSAKYNRILNERDIKPSEAKKVIIGELNSSISACLNLEIESIGSVEEGKGTLYFKKIDQLLPFEFNVLSSGEKEVVDILLDLYLRKDAYNNTIFLIDEPELHINTSIQKKLLIQINHLVGENCQIWLATHSIGFLRALQEELKDQSQVIYFNPENKLGLEAAIIEPISGSRSDWQNIFATALDDLTGLISPKRIIYCEGIGKPSNAGADKGFDAKVLNNIFNNEFHDTLFVSSGGNTELDQRSSVAIAILTKVFADVEILVLKDRDSSSGKFTTQNDRRIYLESNGKNHRAFKRWELENYLFDKEVLQKYCSHNHLVFAETEYDSYVTNIVDQNLKDNISRIRNFCNINTSINPEVFKINLSKFITPDMTVYKELKQCIFTYDFY